MKIDESTRTDRLAKLAEYFDNIYKWKHLAAATNPDELVGREPNFDIAEFCILRDLVKSVAANVGQMTYTVGTVYSVQDPYGGEYVDAKLIAIYTVGAASSRVVGWFERDPAAAMGNYALFEQHLNPVTVRGLA